MYGPTARLLSRSESRGPLLCEDTHTHQLLNRVGKFIQPTQASVSVCIPKHRWEFSSIEHVCLSDRTPCSKQHVSFSIRGTVNPVIKEPENVNPAANNSIYNQDCKVTAAEVLTSVPQYHFMLAAHQISHISLVT